MEEAAKLLNQSARPVMWAGGGVLRSGASAELAVVAERLSAPVVDRGASRITDSPSAAFWIVCLVDSIT